MAAPPVNGMTWQVWSWKDTKQCLSKLRDVRTRRLRRWKSVGFDRSHFNSISVGFVTIPIASRLTKCLQGSSDFGLDYVRQFYLVFRDFDCGCPSRRSLSSWEQDMSGCAWKRSLTCNEQEVPCCNFAVHFCRKWSLLFQEFLLSSTVHTWAKFLYLLRSFDKRLIRVFH